MGVLLRARCDCSFTCTLVSGLTRAGQHVPYFCTVCRTYRSESVPPVPTGLPDTPSSCRTCGGGATAVDIEKVNCPWCGKQDLVFWPVSMVP